MVQEQRTDVEEILLERHIAWGGAAQISFSVVIKCADEHRGRFLLEDDGLPLRLNPLSASVFIVATKRCGSGVMDPPQPVIRCNASEIGNADLARHLGISVP